MPKKTAPPWPQRPSPLPPGGPAKGVRKSRQTAPKAVPLTGTELDRKNLSRNLAGARAKIVQPSDSFNIGGDLEIAYLEDAQDGGPVDVERRAAAFRSKLVDLHKELANAAAHKEWCQQGQPMDGYSHDGLDYFDPPFPFVQWPGYPFAPPDEAQQRNAVRLGLEGAEIYAKVLIDLFDPASYPANLPAPQVGDLVLRTRGFMQRLKSDGALQLTQSADADDPSEALQCAIKSLGVLSALL